MLLDFHFHAALVALAEVEQGSEAERSRAEALAAALIASHDALSLRLAEMRGGSGGSETLGAALTAYLAICAEIGALAQGMADRRDGYA